MSEVAYIGPPVANESEAFDKVLHRALETGLLAVDTETVSLKVKDCIGIGIGTDQARLYAATESDLLQPIMELLADTRVTKVYFNAMFDLGVEDQITEMWGWEPVDQFNIADVSVMAQVQGLPHSLAELVLYVLHERIDEISDILPARKTMLDLEFATVAKKCLDDVKNTLELFQVMNGGWWLDRSNLALGHASQGQGSFSPATIGEKGHIGGTVGPASGSTGKGPRINAESAWSDARYDQNMLARGNHWFPPPVTGDQWWVVGAPSEYIATTRMRECYQVDMQLIPLLRKMSARGMALRKEVVESWYQHHAKERLFYLDMFMDHGINPGSNQQVGYLLASRGTILPFTKSKKQYKVDDKTLRKVEDPLAAAVLGYRKNDKLLGTYLRPCRDQDRFYYSFRQDLSTSRLASFDRNIQNIPTKIRDIFEADSGTFTVADASQIEMRFFAYLTQDPVMLEAYRTGKDIHAITQQALWPGSDPKDEEARTRAKTFNFAMIYFATAETLAENTGLPVSVCTVYREQWLALYHVAHAWMVRQAESAMEKGYAETEYGRRMKLPDIAIYPESHIEKCAINYPVQGTAAEIIKRAMLVCDGEGLDIIAQVHDEILIDGDVEFPAAIPYLFSPMEIPFKVGRSANWEKP